MISTKGRYALRLMVDLAMQEPDSYTPLKDISQRQGISEKYLEIIIKQLVKHRLIQGLRGFCEAPPTTPSARYWRLPENSSPPYPAFCRNPSRATGRICAPPLPCGKNLMRSRAISSTESQ